MGMSYDEYWHGDVWLVEAYREADKLRQERQNEGFWLQGMYVHEAVSVSIGNAFRKSGSNPVKYSSKPYDFTNREKTEEEIAREEENDRLKAMLYMNNMVRAGKNWNNRG